MTISDYYDSLAVSTSTYSSRRQSEQLVTISVATAIVAVLVLFLIAMIHTNGFTVKLIELLIEIKCFNITITSSEINTLRVKCQD
ncbi:hypothetical protein EB796_020368 [Bugula neritina]|uniref:Uncharacterized protein n=1 Tax=Bugula neritina TaxID=10212 RepID=A0A7J7J5A6_BUGNE|nr:hypothetical protein EB796_020368 [Bugula neritina]